jgi:hypothetical protein
MTVIAMKRARLLPACACEIVFSVVLMSIDGTEVNVAE